MYLSYYCVTLNKSIYNCLFSTDLQASLSSIASYLHSIPLLCNIEGVLSLVHPFIPSATHPFEASIIAAKVPATARGGPDLLLHKLPITLPDIASQMDVDIINEDEEGLRYPTKAILQKNCQHHIFYKTL